MPNSKRIALFLDGTWNTVKNNTNVWRAKSLCLTSDDQISYYSQGVGTLFGQRFMGGAFGYGLDEEVINAYEWLIENYNPGDKIFIFGFSRGAYTARALTGLISECGLLVAGAPLSVDQLYARYRKRQATSIRKLAHADDASLTMEDRWLKRYSQAIAIWFIGVWDTVGALGLPFGNIPVVSRSQYRFLQTDLWINDDAAYHALAIDEHRRAFTPTLWTWPHAEKDSAANSGVYAFPDIQKVEQRWFVGAHANVGGGYANDILAQRPLMWLMEKARSKGLVFRDLPADVETEQGLINNSFLEMAYGIYAFFHLFIPFRRPLGQVSLGSGADTKFVVNETIDESVFARWRSDASYRPKNLTTWAKRFLVDPNSINTTVRADDPGVSVD